MTDQEEFIRSETLRLANLGFFTVSERMKITGLELGALVESVSFVNCFLSIVAGGKTYAITPSSITFRTTEIRVWIGVGSIRKCLLVLGATVDDRFVAEANPARIVKGLAPILTPEQRQIKASQAHKKEMADLAKPLAQKVVGKTIVEVCIENKTSVGDTVTLIFSDSTSITFDTDIRDYDIPVLLVDGKEFPER